MWSQTLSDLFAFVGIYFKLWKDGVQQHYVYICWHFVTEFWVGAEGSQEPPPLLHAESPGAAPFSSVRSVSSPLLSLQSPIFN